MNIIPFVIIFLIISIVVSWERVNRDWNESYFYRLSFNCRINNLTMISKILFYPVCYISNIIMGLINLLMLLVGLICIIIILICIWYLHFYYLLIKSIFIKNVDWSNLPVKEY